MSDSHQGLSLPSSAAFGDLALHDQQQLLSPLMVKGQHSGSRLTARLLLFGEAKEYEGERREQVFPDLSVHHPAKLFLSSHSENKHTRMGDWASDGCSHSSKGMAVAELRWEPLLVFTPLGPSPSVGYTLPHQKQSHEARGGKI